MLRLCTERKLEELETVRKMKTNAFEKMDDFTSDSVRPHLPLEIIEVILAQLCYEDEAAGVRRIREHGDPRPESFCTLRLLESPIVGADWKSIIWRYLPLRVYLTEYSDVSSPNPRTNSLVYLKHLCNGPDGKRYVVDSSEFLLYGRSSVEVNAYVYNAKKSPVINCLRSSMQHSVITVLNLVVYGPDNLLSALRACGPAIKQIRKLMVYSNHQRSSTWDISKSGSFDDIEATSLREITTLVCALEYCVRLAPNVQRLIIICDDTTSSTLAIIKYLPLIPTSLTRLHIDQRGLLGNSAMDPSVGRSLNAIDLPNLVYLKIEDHKVEFATLCLLHLNCPVLHSLEVWLPGAAFFHQWMDEPRAEFVRFLANHFPTIKSLEFQIECEREIPVRAHLVLFIVQQCPKLNSHRC